MTPHRKRIVIVLCGIAVNITFAVFLMLMAVNHPDWQARGVSEETKVKYYREPLRVLCNGALPLTSAVMVFSAILIWRLRKSDSE
jgi:hypothetical protein